MSSFTPLTEQTLAPLGNPDDPGLEGEVLHVDPATLRLVLWEMKHAVRHDGFFDACWECMREAESLIAELSI